jgi:hypothetical protein
VNVKAFLEGYYRGSNAMSAGLYELGFISDPTATDSVTVNIWKASNLSATNPDTTVKGFIRTNGRIAFSLPSRTIGLGTNFYIAIKHRNSIETWSANPILSSGSVSYDFSTGLDKAYGDGTNAPMKNMGNGVYAIYGGDVNNDGTADATDLQITENDAYNFFFGYNASDCTGDGASDASDMQLIENNANLFLFMARPY